MTRGGGFPRGLALLGYLSGILLVLIYLGRLIVFDAASPLLLGPAALEGYVVNPVWDIWLGLTFSRGRGPGSAARPHVKCERERQQPFATAVHVARAHTD